MVEATKGLASHPGGRGGSSNAPNCFIQRKLKSTESYEPLMGLK